MLALVSIWPSASFRSRLGMHKFAADPCSDDLHFGNIIRSHLRDESRVRNVYHLETWSRPKREHVPDQQRGEDRPPKQKISRRLRSRSRYPSLGSCILRHHSALVRVFDVLAAWSYPMFTGVIGMLQSGTYFSKR